VKQSFEPVNRRFPIKNGDEAAAFLLTERRFPAQPLVDATKD